MQGVTVDKLHVEA